MISPKPSRRNKADFAPNDETFRLLFENHPLLMLVYDLKTLIHKANLVLRNLRWCLRSSEILFAA